MSLEGFEIRAATPEEYPFIYNSFLKSLRQSAPYSMIPSVAFYAQFHDLMEAWLEIAGALVAVVKTSDGSDEIAGWAVTHGTSLLYVYVKKDFRGMGVARGLLSTPENTEPEFFSPLSSQFLSMVPAVILASRLDMLKPKRPRSKKGC